MKILSTLFTLLALAAACGSGGIYFLTKDKLEDASAELSSTRSSLDTAQAELDRAKTQILSTEQLLKTAQTELAQNKQQSFDLSRKMVTYQSNSQSGQDKIASLERQILEVQNDNSNLRKKLLSRASVTPADLGGASPEEVERLKSEIVKLEDKVSSLEAESSKGGSTNNVLASTIPVVDSEPSAYKTAPTGQLQGTIARLNSESGILVLARGSSHGIKPDAEYILMRGGYLLAKVRVTKLTADHTVATILPNIGIPNSLRSGDTVAITR